MSQPDMSQFIFRWHDPVGNKWATFIAINEAEFRENATDAAISYRLNSRKRYDNTYYYPMGKLEIQVKDKLLVQLARDIQVERWCGIRVPWNCTPFTLLSMGGASDDSGKKESDITRINNLAEVWWKSINRWAASWIHHLLATAAQDSLPAHATSAPEIPDPSGPP